MTYHERSPFGVAVYLEHRPDRDYDETDPSTVLHPNGTRISSGDRWFVGAALRLTVAQTEATG